MNLFFGLVIGFLGWSFLGFLFCWLLLRFYEDARYPLGKLSEDDRKENSRLMVRYALYGGLLIWCLVDHLPPATFKIAPVAAWLESQQSLLLAAARFRTAGGLRIQTNVA
jgi:hypothetical protein